MIPRVEVSRLRLRNKQGLFLVYSLTPLIDQLDAQDKIWLHITENSTVD